jgi:hypothetical protein
VDSSAPGPSGVVLCPICHRPLRWAPDRWLATFDCDRCGQFPDFSSTPSARRAQSWRSSPLSEKLPYEPSDARPITGAGHLSAVDD